MGKTAVKSGSAKHADRKFEKKLQFYVRVRDTVAALSIQKAITKNKKHRSRQRKLKAYDLSSLSEFLPDPKASCQPTPIAHSKLNSKSRQNLVLKEENQLRKVLDHPSFQSDPLAAIHQHLQCTQPITEKPVRKNNINGSKKAKEKKAKSRDSLSMEM